MKSRRAVSCVALLLLIDAFDAATTAPEAAALTPPPASGRSRENVAELVPADVLARVRLFGEELELIRLELGMPPPEDLETRVTAAAPREVYFQAVSL